MDSEGIFRALAKTVLLALGLWLLVSFLKSVSLVLLLFVLALIIFLAANPVVTYFEQKRVPRVISALGLLLGVLLVIGGLSLFIAPQFSSQLGTLLQNLPEYGNALGDRLSDLLDRYPRTGQWVRNQIGDGSGALERMPSLLARVGTYTLGAITGFIFLIILIAIVIYMLAQPRPLLKGYLGIFPEPLRHPAAVTFARSNKMVLGWVKSNLIVGGVEAVFVGIFLTIMGIPGALVWALVAFFAELVPKIGPYLQTIPPVLLALTISPMTAVWVLVFYLVLQELTGDILAPKIRGSEMKLHPVSLMFGVLAMTMAFGFLGAIIATPVVGIVKVAYEEFYLKRLVHDKSLDQRTEQMLTGEVGGAS